MCTVRTSSNIKMAQLPAVFVIAPSIEFGETGLILQNAFVSFRTYPAPVDLQNRDGKLVAHSVLAVWVSESTYLNGKDPVGVADVYFDVDPRIVDQLRASAAAQIAAFDFTQIKFGVPMRTTSLELVTQVIPVLPVPN